VTRDRSGRGLDRDEAGLPGHLWRSADANENDFGSGDRNGRIGRESKSAGFHLLLEEIFNPRLEKGGNPLGEECDLLLLYIRAHDVMAEHG
jgi:hypothetical protein